MCDNVDISKKYIDFRNAEMVSIMFGDDECITIHSAHIIEAIKRLTQREINSTPNPRAINPNI